MLKNTCMQIFVIGKDVAREQLRLLINTAAAYAPPGTPEAGKVMIDTASAYQNNYTERVLGDLLAEDLLLRSKISIHTKANCNQFPYKSLSKESVLYQANMSLKNLRVVDSIDIYYLHYPDINTPIDQSLDAIEQLHREGKIKEFGLSNYPSWKVVDIWYRCKERNMVRPTVYQGCYNALTRSIEFEATAAFRELGIRSYHYNPLAGGLLSGKYESMESQLKESGRFGSASPVSGAAYSARYWHQEYFKALQIVKDACDKEGIKMSEAALRWLNHHSILTSEYNDGIIFGASSLENAIENIKSCQAGPLPPSIVDAYDKAWEICRFASTSYFRYYGTSPGISDLFLKKYQKNIPKSLL